MKARGGEEMKRSAWLAELVNRWWDLVNTRFGCTYNEDLRPYYEASDERLQWLSKTFLAELDGWKNSLSGETGKEREKKVAA